MMDKTNPHHEYVYLANLSSLKNQLPQSDRKKANKNYDKIAQWINIEGKSLIQLIVLTFVDPDKKQILNLTAKKSLTVPEILQMYEMSKTSGYRTINSLIKSGLLVKNSIGNIKNGKKINKYRSIFEDVKIKIETNKVSVLAKFAKV